MRKLFLLALVILLLPGIGLAQEKRGFYSDEEIAAITGFLKQKSDAFSRAWPKDMPLTPKGMLADCRPQLVSVVLEFKGGKIQEPVFSTGASNAFKEFIINNLSKLELMPWETRVPSIKGLENYRIFWMHCYVLDTYNSGLYPWLSSDMATQLTDALIMAQNGNKAPLFIAPPHVIYTGPDLHSYPQPPNYKEIMDSALISNGIDPNTRIIK